MTRSVQRAASLGQQIADIIRQRIVRGELQPGDRLTEESLADEFQVSRGPVRDAITQLSFEKLVEVHKPRGIYIVGLTDDDVEQRRKDIIEAVKRVDTGEGVAILTDMFGGTPSNLAISVMSRPKVEVLAGINLPMLVKLAKIRDETPLQEAVVAAQEAGRKYVTIASRVLTGK